jgi:acetylserotonin N-methyltransferase
MIRLNEVPLAHPEQDRAFLDLWISDFAACALSAADEVGLFDELANRVQSAASLADTLQLDREAVVATCRALVALGVLRETTAHFELNEVGALFWVKQSPAYRGREFYRHWDWEQHERIVKTLHSGWSPLMDTDEPFSEAWARGAVSQKSAENFTRVMHSLILMPSLAAVQSGAFAGVRHLVDVGGGSGALAAALLARQPECRATVLDLAPVCSSSRRILADIETGARVEHWPANLFVDGWPVDADAFSLSNILHDWPLAKGREILDRALKALPAGGRIFVQEALLDEGRCAPRMTVLFNLLMRMNHRGQQFTRKELIELLGEQGFVGVKVVHTYSYWSLVVATKPS